MLYQTQKRIKGLTKRSDGTAAIEFALISPILMLVVIASIELGLITLATSVLETATANAARSGKPTGDQLLIESEVKRIGSGLLKPAGINFRAIPNGSITSDGGQLFTYETTYSWPLFTPLMSNIFGDANGNYNIVVTIPAIVEP